MNNFDWKTYIENYEDLQKANINTQKSAWAHWINYGQKENRTCVKINNIVHNSTDDITQANNTEKKNLVIIACHTNNNLKYTVLKNNIKYFEKDNMDIILINSTEYEKYYDYSISNKIIDTIFIDNSVTIDFGKWIYVLENRDYVTNYKNIIFTNDSYIIVNEIDDFFEKINKNNYDLYGYNDSSEIKYHYQSYLFAVNTTKLPNLLKLFHDHHHKINSTQDAIIFYEINLINYFQNKNCHLKITHLTNGNNVFFRSDNVYENLLKKKLLPFIKIKRLFYADPNKILIPNFIKIIMWKKNILLEYI
jgi:hypothetical protein